MSEAKKRLDDMIAATEKDCTRIDKAVATLVAKGTNPEALVKKVMEQARLWECRRTLYWVKGALGDTV